MPTFEQKELEGIKYGLGKDKREIIQRLPTRTTVNLGLLYSRKGFSILQNEWLKGD